jgi:hypothetical protein
VLKKDEFPSSLIAYEWRLSIRWTAGIPGRDENTAFVTGSKPLRVMNQHNVALHDLT